MERKLLTFIAYHCGIHDFNFILDPMININNLGTRTKVQVNGKRSDGTEVTLYWLMKTGPLESVKLTLAQSGRFLHGLESFSYRTLLPAFRTFQRMCEPFKAYPKLMGHFGPMSKDIFIIEDMKHKGYILKDRCEPLDFNHLAVVLKTYAHFHAISLAMRNQQPHNFHKLYEELRNCVFLFGNMDVFNINKMESVNGRLLKMLECDQYQEHRRLFGKYALLYPDVMKKTYRKQQHTCRALGAFYHGGSNLLNILFKYGDKTKPNVPTKVCLIDFQMLRYGSPIFDLSYFIFTATDKATRDEHYDQLIDIYYREVCMRLEQMGSPPAVVFPYDKFQLRLKRFSVLGYFMAQMALYTMLRAPSIKVTDQMTEAEIKESMERNIVESEALYDERIKGMLIDFVEKGYFDFLDEEYPDMEFDESTTDSTDDNMADEEDL